MTKKQLLSLFVLLTGVAGLEASVADSRYFPWYPHMYERTLQKRSIFDAGAFFVTASRARGNESIEHISIPEIWGVYDQKQLSDALGILGKTTPLLAQWQLQGAIAWDVKGKMEGQGGYLQFEYGTKKGFSVGVTTSVMHLTSDQRFTIPVGIKRGSQYDSNPRRDMGLTPSQEEQLDAQRREIQELLGFTNAQWSATGFTDTEFHVRYGFLTEYRLKCRKVDGGVFAGILVPSGVKRQPNNPASVPFGGNGHTGFYAGAEGMFEIKEDWELSIRLQASKRLAKTQIGRMPINYEPVLWGAVEGPVRVDPGASFLFTPAFTMHDLRDGFGAGIQYCMAIHGGDVWTDERADQTIPTTLNGLRGNSGSYLIPGLYERSKWAAEYIIATIFYDPDRLTKDEGIRPYVVFQWDVPLHLFIEEKVSKTNTISLGLSFHF